MTEQSPATATPQNQINLSYNSVEDRILIRACENGKEYRAWWTRRLALRLFKLFQEHRFPTENSASHLQPEQQQSLGDIEKHGAVQQADFSTPFQDGAEHFPLGENGILVQRVDIKTEGKIVRFVMLPAEGEGMTLSLPPGQRYSFEHMLQQVMVAAEWIEAKPDDRAGVPHKPILAH
ncbi:hypothetical protein [Amphritea pacifica]|uniref:Uncharacterized protein n=1 Tax=Amphritea pacifica TaxID=2811233 RepID=A0ABS2W9T9_9GAMM|nr:hypothetical protein [Amphritea pacifica]MBN0988391.1 hypothetical protein [Amphritea pacifica]MBN1006647.1 hypothetical protein [Amphritea pacifica]